MPGGKVVRKQVWRWFYGGRGYASARAAYRAMAHDELLEELLGPRVRSTRAYLAGLSSVQAEVEVAHRFANKFPPTRACNCCWDDSADEPRRTFCVKSRDRWLSARALRLEKESV